MTKTAEDSFRGKYVASGKKTVALVRNRFDIIPVRLQLPDCLPDGGAAEMQPVGERGAGDKGVRMGLKDLQDLLFRHAGISSFDIAGHRRRTSAAASRILIPSGIR